MTWRVCIELTTSTKRKFPVHRLESLRPVSDIPLDGIVPKAEPDRAETHAGEHEAIVDPELFKAVQAKLNGAAVDRQMRLKASPALLAGRQSKRANSRVRPTVLHRETETG